MIFDFMKTHRGEFSIDRMARVLEVSRATFYRFLNRVPSARGLADQRLTGRIVRIFHEQRRCGVLKIRRILQHQGERVGKTRIHRLMKTARISGKSRRKFRVCTTDSNHRFRASPNLLDRKFYAKKVDRVWVSDITFLRTRHGWAYLCVVLDLFSRRVVGWSVDDRMPAQLAVSALTAAVVRRRPPAGLIFHSDQGVQYASRAFRLQLRRHRMVQSMSRRGNCWDNACAESFFSILKEGIGTDEFVDVDHAREVVFEFIELFYNARRVHGSIGFKSPNEFEVLSAA